MRADRKWGQAYLTHDFFHCLGEAMPEKVLLVIAEEDTANGPMVAGALNLIGSDALFGRNWGCTYGSAVKNLHFELCYYQVCRHNFSTSSAGFLLHHDHSGDVHVAAATPTHLW